MLLEATSAVAKPLPQQARSRATRLRLLESTAEALEGLGYARTTTTEVCRRAGVSQGALFKHFATKADLIANTTRHVFAGLIAEYRQGFAAIDGRGDDVRAALALLWQTFQGARLAVVFELYTAARTDEALRAALLPVMTEHRENLYAEAGALFPAAAARNPNFRTALDTIVMALQGAALARLATGNVADEEPMLAYLERQARTELEETP